MTAAAVSFLAALEAESRHLNRRWTREPAPAATDMRPVNGRGR